MLSSFQIYDHEVQTLRVSLLFFWYLVYLNVGTVYPVGAAEALSNPAKRQAASLQNALSNVQLHTDSLVSYSAA